MLPSSALFTVDCFAFFSPFQPKFVNAVPVYSMESVEIVHLKDKNEFWLPLSPPTGKTKKQKFALLQYQQVEPGVYDLYHTEGILYRHIRYLRRCLNTQINNILCNNMYAHCADCRYVVMLSVIMLNVVEQS